MCINVIRDTTQLIPSNYLCIKGGLLHGAETANKSHRWKPNTLPVYGRKIQTQQRDSRKISVCPTSLEVEKHYKICSLQ